LGLNLLSVVMDAMFDSWFVAGGFHLDGIGDFASPF
jgi:cobalamin synthase